MTTTASTSACTLPITGAATTALFGVGHIGVAGREHTARLPGAADDARHATGLPCR